MLIAFLLTWYNAIHCTHVTVYKLVKYTQIWSLRPDVACRMYCSGGFFCYVSVSQPVSRVGCHVTAFWQQSIKFSRWSDTLCAKLSTSLDSADDFVSFVAPSPYFLLCAAFLPDRASHFYHICHIHKEVKFVHETHGIPHTRKQASEPASSVGRQIMLRAITILLRLSREIKH